jgi:hypothetical protein
LSGRPSDILKVLLAMAVVIAVLLHLLFLTPIVCDAFGA